MKILVISGGDLEKGSIKYRIAQYTDFLEANGLKLDFVKRSEIDRSFIPKLKMYDVVFNQRCLIRASLARKIIANSRRLVFDFDDAIYTRPGKPHFWLTSLRVKRRLRIWIQGADVVTTANHFLAAYAGKYSSCVKVIPNAVDLETWKPATRERGETVTIGWAGAPVNIPNIERLEPVLSELLSKYPFLKLAVFSGKRPNLKCPFDYYSFEPGKEPEFVRSLDIGLLPLVNEEYSKGKSPIKAIQYLACGVPVVGNPIGATKEILNDDNSIAVSSDEEWIAALESLVKDNQRRASMGRAGRAHVERNHNIRLTAKQRLSVFLGTDTACAA